LDLNKSYKDDNGNFVNPTCFSQNAFYQTEFSEIIFNKNVKDYYIYPTTPASGPHQNRYYLETFNEMPYLKTLSYTGRIHLLNRNFITGNNSHAEEDRMVYSILKIDKCNSLTEIYLPKVAILHQFADKYIGGPEEFFKKPYDDPCLQYLHVTNCEKLEKITVAFMGTTKHYLENFEKKLSPEYMLYLKNLPKLTSFYSSAVGLNPHPSDSVEPNYIFGTHNYKKYVNINDVNCS